MKMSYLTLCAAALVSSLAYGQTSPPPADAPATDTQGARGAGRPNFDTVKQRRLAELQEITQCVQNASTMAALRECKPHHPNRQEGAPPQ